MPRLPKIEDIENNGSSEEARELGPKMPDDEFIPCEAITFLEFRDRLGKAMFPDDWTGEECAGWFKSSFGRAHRSEAERDADLERRRAQTRKQYELAGLPMRTSREVAEHRDGGVDDTYVEVFHEFLPLTPDQRAEIDRELEPLYKKALAVKHRREAVESELQQIFWAGTLVAFYISRVDGQKVDISHQEWGVKQKRVGKFYSDKVWLHEAGVFHVEVSGERRVFTVLIDEEESKAVLATYSQGEPKEAASQAPGAAEERPHSEIVKGFETDADHPQEPNESRREKQKREKREEYKDWYDLALEIKGRGEWTSPIDIAGQVAKRRKGTTAGNVKRRLNQYYRGWAN